MIVYIYNADDFILRKPPICVVSCDVSVNNDGVRLSKNGRVFAKIKMSDEDSIYITDHSKIVLSNPPSDETIEIIKKICD